MPRIRLSGERSVRDAARKQAFPCSRAKPSNFRLFAPRCEEDFFRRFCRRRRGLSLNAGGAADNHFRRAWMPPETSSEFLSLSRCDLCYQPDIRGNSDMACHYAMKIRRIDFLLFPWKFPFNGGIFVCACMRARPRAHTQNWSAEFDR